jgi:muramoyltetrapeptide carboxypeptidase
MNTLSRRNAVSLIGLAVLGTSCLSVRKEEADEQGSDTIKPKALKKGDLVAICAPAGCISEPEEILEFTDVIRDLGFRVKKGRNIASRFGYFSAPDESRAAEFMEMIGDPEVKAIFFIRGGWGCARIIPFLDFAAIRNNPKVIMGFSDISSLLNAITSKTGLVTFHGPNGNASWNSRTMEYFHSLLFHGKACSFHNRTEDLKVRTIHAGIAEGELFGGNLTVVNSMIGTGHLPDWTNKILFLEDLKEEPYRIDRMLTQLKLAGVLDAVSGIILGAFRDCVAEEPDRAFTIDQVFDQHFKGLNKPVFSNAQFGHVVNKFILPVGTKVRMNADRGTIEMLEAGVDVL